MNISAGSAEKKDLLSSNSTAFNDDSDEKNNSFEKPLVRDRLIDMEILRNLDNSGSSAKESQRKFTLEQLAENGLVTPASKSILKEQGAACKPKISATPNTNDKEIINYAAEMENVDPELSLRIKKL